MTRQAVNTDLIPDELKKLSSWTCWIMEPRAPGEEPTKIPYSAQSGYRAKSNDPSTWTTFDAACRSLATGRFCGIAFVLAPPYLGVDLDDCRNSDSGVIAPAAMQIVLALNTYSEISYSDCGVKMILRGVMPTPDGTGKNYRSGRSWNDGPAAVEMYGNRRMFALTGQRLACISPNIESRNAELGQLYRRLYPPRPLPRSRPIIGDAGNRIERAAKYLAKMEPSISGQGGHGRLLAAACALARLFGIVGADAMPLLCAFNSRCQPPWSERDLEHKAREAEKLAGDRIGEMILQGAA